MTAERLHRRERLWTLTTLAHVVPFVLVAIGMVLLSPLALPVSLAALAHAWMIPELYARRGANVTRSLTPAADGPERVSLGLLGDLVDHDARELHARTGSCPSPAGSARGWSARRARCSCSGAASPAGA